MSDDYGKGFRDAWRKHPPKPGELGHEPGCTCSEIQRRLNFEWEWNHKHHPECARSIGTPSNDTEIN